MSRQTLVLIFQILLLFLALLSLMGLGGYFYQKYTHFCLRRKLTRRFTHAKQGECSAESLLQKQGYRLIKSQKSALLSMWINGEEFSYRVRPDAFVEKDGKRYLVEIKTGSKARDPKQSATRRQLLEYYHGFDVDGVLLVDAELQDVHDIYFQSQAMRPGEVIERKVISKKALLIAFILGMMMALGVLGILRG